MKTNARFTFEKVDFSKKNDVHLVVSLTAPQLDAQFKRPRIAILPVIDVSGSMAGTKLEYAKQSVLKLIDHLQPGDSCGLVTFASFTQMVSPLVEMTPAAKTNLKSKVGLLAPQGGTNFSGGMLDGLAHVNATDLPQGTLIRVVMFTDGQANEGVATTTDALLTLLGQNLGKATVSAFGYGNDANQDMLASLAKAGKGNYAFVKNPDDALSAFAKELGGLLSSYAQNIKVTLTAHAGHAIADVVSDVDSVEQPNGVVVSLSDILAEEVRHLVFEVAVGAQAQAFPRASSIVDVKLEYASLDANGKLIPHVEEMKGKLEFVKPGEEDKAPIMEVMEVVGAALLVQKQIEAEELAKKGMYTQAQDVMRQVTCDFMPLGLNAHAEAAANIGAKFENQVMYSTSSGYLNSMKGGGTRGVGVSSYDPEAEVQLRSMKVATTTSSQTGTVTSFNNGAQVPIPSMIQPGPTYTHANIQMGSGLPLGGMGPQVTVVNYPPKAPSKPSSKPLKKNKSKRW